jgi:hypothetical protein
MNINVQCAKQTRKGECSVCYLRVDSYKNLKKHWMKHLAPGADDEYDNDEEQTNKDEQFEWKLSKVKKKKCPQCSYVTFLSWKMTSHIMCVHDKIKDKQCSQCEFMTSYTGDLAQHIKVVHEKRKDNTCSQCLYETGHSGNLKQHIKDVHDKIKDKECPKCSFVTGRTSTLREHIRECA